MRKQDFPGQQQQGCVLRFGNFPSLCRSDTKGDLAYDCFCWQVRDDLRRDNPDVTVNVHELRDHRASNDSRDVFGVLMNFFRLLTVRVSGWAHEWFAPMTITDSLFVCVVSELAAPTRPTYI